MQLLIRQLINITSCRMWISLPAEAAAEQPLPNKEETLQSLPVDTVSLNIINYRCHQKMSGERPINASDVKVPEIIIILDTYLEMLRMFKAGEKQHMC